MARLYPRCAGPANAHQRRLALVAGVAALLLLAINFVTAALDGAVEQISQAEAQLIVASLMITMALTHTIAQLMSDDRKTRSNQKILRNIYTIAGLSMLLASWASSSLT